MADRNTRKSTGRGSSLPHFHIVSGFAALPAGPLTLFEIALYTGDLDDAVLTVRTRMDADPLICLRARSGDIARFVPAAPTIILDPLFICLSGQDAVGTIAYR